MFFTLDYQSKLPIYEQLYQSVVKMAAIGSGNQNEQLPSVRALASQLGVNPNTVQKAYAMLERDGILVTIPGKGAFLKGENPAAQLLQEEARKNFRTSVQKAKDSHLSKEELLRILEETYMETEEKTND